GWACSANGSEPKLHGLLRWTMGGRHTRRRLDRFQGTHLARLGRSPPQRKAASHGALATAGLRPPGDRGNVYGSRVLQPAVDGEGDRHARAGYGPARVRLRRERTGSTEAGRNIERGEEAIHASESRASSARAVRRNVRLSFPGK